ncbi:hypothetical protein Ancab_016009 [Ancistrocladus abbreviatus]
MGNCLFGGAGEVSNEQIIHVITCNGGIMEFQAPITVGCILKEFSGHAIYPSDHLFWKALPQDEALQPGERYYLLPSSKVSGWHVRSKSIPMAAATNNMQPADAASSYSYRMSLDHGQSHTLKRSHTEVFSRSSSNYREAGVWKVKLVISPEQLAEILSQEARTQELIESVRTVAKCGHYSALGFADYWSTTASSN